MAYKLVCVQPFHGYAKGQEITDPTEVAKLSSDRDHHFVRVKLSDATPPAAPPPKSAA